MSDTMDERRPSQELLVVEWTDTTNIAAWSTLDEVREWAPDGGFRCLNVGWLVHEDDDCVVLAARAAFEATPPQVGLYERIPKTAITRRRTGLAYVLEMPGRSE